MRQGPKPAKSKEAKPPVARKSPKNGAGVRDVEKRLAEALKREAEALGQLQTRDRELAEALDQQTATSEILRVISQSPTDIQPVFDAIVRSAAELCEATFAVLHRFDGQMVTFEAHHGMTEREVEESRRRFPRPTDRGTAVSRAILDRQTTHIHDIRRDPEYIIRAGQTAFRTVLAVPLLREGVPVGAIGLWRRVVQPFSEKQIKLVEIFADQAGIAIENVRLFNETKDALERQTATSDILRVIGSSPTDVQPVFEAIARSGVSVCAALGCAVFAVEGDTIRVAATHGVRPERLERFRQEYPALLDAKIDSAQTIRDRRVFHLADIEHNPNATTSDIENARLAGYQTRLMVPMVRGDRALGLIAVTREAPTPFSDQQVALLQTFADQAVIAIENVRLFNELQVRNHDLAEALIQQTATSEVLKVISRSTFDLQPVLQTLIENATRLCDAQQGFIYRSDGEIHQLAVDFNAPPAFTEWSQQRATRPGDGSVVGRVALEKRVVQILDAQADAEWRARTAHAPGITDVRTLLGVPMLRDGVVIGVFAMWRSETRPFTDKQIDLVMTFADQAVIAIENVRLFKELQTSNRDLTQALDQQTATSEILGVISGSPTDIQPVFDTIVRSAARLCNADDAQLLRTENDVLRLAASHGTIPGESTRPIVRTRVAGRAVIELRAIHVHDLQAESDEFPDAQPWDIRSMLSIPLLREEHALGVIQIRRREVRPFTEAQIALLEIFAAQAVIAIENVRLFKELEAANRELSAASQHKSEFLANMSHELRTPLNAIIGFSEVLSERMFGELNEKQEEYSKDIHASGQHLLSLINDILDLSKIEAGRMELELTDFHLPTALDSALTLVRERAGRRGIALQMNVDNRLGQVQADERKVRQVVLNLLSNAIKFTPEGGSIEIRAVPTDGFVEVSVSDTGVGIAPEDQEAVFEEFRQVGTAAKKVEGTGLGLTLCRKFVELHGGRIWVKSELGAGSTFTFTLPVLRGE